jgi:putative PIN family toxin of toxin-antitoxin system
MARKVDRVIIDTNLWIAFLITKDFRQIDKHITSGRVRLLFSLELIEEFLTVTERPKFKKYFSKTNVDELIRMFDVYGEIIDVKSHVSICRDPKDNFLLSLAKDGQCNYLITGDNDLLDLSKFGRTAIISISDYLLILDKK